MKNLFFALAFMLVGTFAFANTVDENETFKFSEGLELVEDSSNSEIYSNSLVDCLLEITFIYEDGSSETIYVLVIGASCEEVLK